MSADLDPDVRDRAANVAAQAARDAFDRSATPHAGFLAVVDAVAEVLAAGMAKEVKLLRAERELYRSEGLKIQADRDALKARVAEQEIAFAEKLAGAADASTRHVKQLSERVDLLATALTEIVGECEVRASPRVAYIARARAVLSATPTEPVPLKAAQIPTEKDRDAAQIRIAELSTALAELIMTVGRHATGMSMREAAPLSTAIHKATLAWTPKENAVALEVGPEAPSRVVADESS